MRGSRGRKCASWRVQAHAPARLVHSLRLLAKALLVDVSGLRCRRDGRLHDLGGVGDLGAAHELGFLCRELEGRQDGAPVSCGLVCAA